MKKRTICLFALSMPLLFACGESGTSAGSATSEKPILPQLNVGDLTLDYYTEWEGYVVSDYRGSASSISIPSSVTVEGRSYPITRINDRAFYARKSVKEVELPDSIVTIGDHAFEQSGVRTVYATRHLREVGDDILKGTELETNSDSGFLFFQSKTNPYCVLVGGDSRAWSYTIPSQVESIATTALSGLDLGENLDLSNVTSIAAGAFEKCDFKSIKFSDGLEYVGSRAFAGTKSITAFDLPASVKKLGTEILGGWNNLNLTSLTLPFMGTDENTPLRLSKVLGSNFSDDSAPVLTIDRGSIPDGALTHALSEEKKADGSIYYSWGSSPEYRISELKLNKVTSIGISAFSGNDTLKKAALGSALTTIRQSAFRQSGVTHVSIPKSIITLERDAFYLSHSYGCQIEVGRFQEDTALPAMNVDEGWASSNTTVIWGVSQSEDTPTSSDFDFVNSGGHLTITKYKGNATEVVVPEKIGTNPVYSIANSAFVNQPKIKKLTLPTTSIADEALAGLTGLQELNLVLADKDRALYGVQNSFKWFSNTTFTGSYKIDKWVHPLYPMNEVYIKCFVPNSFKKFTVTCEVANKRVYFGVGTFAYFTSLNTLEFNCAGGVELAQNAFYSCTNLTGTLYLSHACHCEANAITGCSKLSIQVEDESDIEAWGTIGEYNTRYSWTDQKVTVAEGNS